MLTRAYDAIMMGLVTPQWTVTGDPIFSTTLGDQYMNYKDYSGNVRNASHGMHATASTSATVSMAATGVPFSSFLASPGSASSAFYPDEDSSEPSYEDYVCVTNAVPTGWKCASTNFANAVTNVYDPSTGEFVSSLTSLWQNSSGSAKTVYGIRVRTQCFYRSTVTGSATSTTYALVCREKFAEPVVVENNGIMSLTLTWRVGRSGKVTSVSAS